MDINITNPVTKEKIGEVVNGSASATPNNTDLVMSVDASVAKKNTWTQIKAFLKTYFDTIYKTTDHMIVSFYPQTRFSPSDGATYYFGASANVTIQTSNGFADFIAPCDLKIKAVYWVTTQGAGSSELVILDFITNGVDVTNIGTTTMDATRVTGHNDALDITVLAGQTITIRATMPNFSTNPNNHSGGYSVLMEKI